MQQELLEKLRSITAEEQDILNKKVGIERSLYSSGGSFVIDRRKMIESGKLIDIRTHTRFVHFPQHSHNYIEIIYMCSGCTTHIINQKERVVLKKGNLLFLNQNATHEILPAKKEDIAVNIMVMPEFFDAAFVMMEDENVVRDFLVGALKQNGSGMDYIHFKASDILPVQNLIENMIWSLLHRQSNKRRINQMTMGLLILQLANHTDCIDTDNPNQYEQNLMLAILQYMEDNYKEAALTELAQKYNQSIPGMSRFIKKNSGQTFQQLLQQKRLNQAVFLLNTTRLSIEDIIAAVGYDNSSYFHRIFKERYGLTPKKYRMEKSAHSILNSENKDSILNK